MARDLRKYQLTPEYRQVNQGMSARRFKGIFWWEYFHRLLGRMIGVVFLVPLLWFVWRGADRPAARVEARRHIRARRAAGRDGLVHGEKRPRRRSARVAVPPHRAPGPCASRSTPPCSGPALGAALSAARGAGHVGCSAGAHFALALAALVFVMALTGGFVAGIRAGFAYNTFPLMNGHLVPPELFMLEPWYLNFFNNMATVQFDHRLIAWLLAVLVPWFWVEARTTTACRRARLRRPSAARSRSRCRSRSASRTLLLVVPVPLAAAHQAGAVLVFAAALNVAHSLR